MKCIRTIEYESNDRDAIDVAIKNSVFSWVTAALNPDGTITAGCEPVPNVKLRLIDERWQA